MQPELKRLVVEIPDKQKLFLKKIADKNGQTIAYIIRSLINEYEKNTRRKAS